MSGVYDRDSYDAGRKDAAWELVEQMELMIAEQDFRNPRLYAMLREVDAPPKVIGIMLELQERATFEGYAPSYYKIVNGIMTEIICPILDMYAKGLTREADALLKSKERDRRTRVIKSKKSKIKDKIRGAKSDGEEEESP